ncbi:MAG: alpha/beta hydrolase [Lachnospiraceae bacterium]|nr:alpha/beta hydrolase [Lachnospiraceae bacterium]
MFDGHNLFFDSDATYGKSWGMEEYLDFTDTQIIVAAVDCNHSPDNGRLKEYCPFDFDDPQFGHIEGRGEITMDWYSTVFKRLIDERYRTLRGRKNTFIAGSSMGGLMSLYAVTVYNQVYSRAAALSPSLWTDSFVLDNMVRDSRIARDTVVYMDYGSKELGNRTRMKRAFQDMAKALMDKNIHLTTRIIPGGTHCEASWERQLPFFMNTLLYGLED